MEIFDQTEQRAEAHFWSFTYKLLPTPLPIDLHTQYEATTGDIGTSIVLKIRQFGCFGCEHSILILVHQPILSRGTIAMSIVLNISVASFQFGRISEKDLKERERYSLARSSFACRQPDLTRLYIQCGKEETCGNTMMTFEVDLHDDKEAGWEPTSVGTKGGSGEIAAAQVSYWLVSWKPTCQVSYSQNLAASTVRLQW